MELSTFEWINEPEKYKIDHDKLVFITESKTDFWQRTYYGFQNDNAHAFVFKTNKNEFSFSVSTCFSPKKLFDQCGLIIYVDSENWFKVSVEYDNHDFSRLGSVVTNVGYSDWATMDIRVKRQIQMKYRLSRRKSDFLIENSQDGIIYQQMRIFHLHKALKEIRMGVYACSPLDSSISAEFSNFSFGKCVWESYRNHE